jgi:regulator of replication initiation timing
MNKISLCLLLVVLAGCQDQIIPISGESAPMTVRQDSNSMEQRFTDSQKIDPVTTITMWAQRYDELLKQSEQMRKENAKVLEENNRLQQEMGKMKLDLEQTRRDVEQSNTLLQQAHVELSKWKADVLGFRDEMRQSQTAQMTALSRILRILGAESALPPKEAAKDPKFAPQEGTKQ